MILIRHGQSYFNLHYGETRIDPGIPDPALTEAGRQQARAAVESLRTRALKRLIASPYTRALETAHIIADGLGLPIAVEPLVRERAAFTCDIGTPRSALARRWPQLSFDHLEERWWGEQEESETALNARSRHFKALMAATPDWPEVAVITHWGFIRALTGETVVNGAQLPFDPTAAASP
jgi:broad specificity phosphatase PhoE